VSVRFRGVLDAVTRVRGVRGVMIVASEDGLVVAESLMEGVRGNALAALASSLMKHVAHTAKASGIGAPRFLHLQAALGVVLTVAAGEILVVAIGDPSVNIGLVRLELIRAAEAVS
jgi:predicted regulator of Ras-like GTPase activity (Roadblock/LC7/MglB family)